jgi:hypothetical protein
MILSVYYGIDTPSTPFLIFFSKNISCLDCTPRRPGMFGPHRQMRATPHGVTHEAYFAQYWPSALRIP